MGRCERRVSLFLPSFDTGHVARRPALHRVDEEGGAGRMNLSADGTLGGGECRRRPERDDRYEWTLSVAPPPARDQACACAPLS